MTKTNKISIPIGIKKLFLDFFDSSDNLDWKIFLILKDIGFNNINKQSFSFINYDDSSFIISDKDDVYKITLVFSNIYNPSIIVENASSKKTYEYIISEEKLSIVFFDLKNSILKNFYYYISVDGLFLEFILGYNHYVINFKDYDNIIEDIYNVKNQGLLFDKLSKIDDSYTFVDIFKLIYNISLENNSILYFSLELSQKYNNEYQRQKFIEIINNKIYNIEALTEEKKLIFDIYQSNVNCDTKHSKLKGLLKKKTNF